MKQAEIQQLLEDTTAQETKLVEKNVFIIFFQGERAKEKIKKICESYGANLYPCPDTPRQRSELLKQVETRLDDLDVVLQRSLEHTKRVLKNVAEHLPAWKEKVWKEKVIYENMNKFNYDVGRRCLIAEGWCPLNAIDEVQERLKRANQRSGALVPSILNVVSSKKTNQKPPTYFKTNKFLKTYQSIVDAYGTPRYGEVNPAVFTVITFPFLFGVMFGDVGHGAMLFLFALVMVLYEKKLEKIDLFEMIAMCFQGRYVLLLMGIFAVYCGSLYNECFSVPIDAFGSRWANPTGNSTMYDWKRPLTAYPWGVDPTWKGAKNELDFYNSLKMKLSVVMGVTQMTVGIILSGFNAVHFRLPYDFFFEFIPQLLFLLSIFGYMCFLILLKWSTNYYGKENDAPQLLNIMIDSMS